MCRFFRLLIKRAVGKTALPICLAASVASSACADEVDLLQAVQLGQRHDESVQIAQKGVEETRLQKRISYAPLLPQVSAVATGTHQENVRRLSGRSPFDGSSLGGGNSDGYSESLRLSQTLWNARQHSDYANSKKNLELAHVDNARIIAANLTNVTEAYLGVLSATSRLRLARSNVAGVEAHKEIVDTLFSIHESTILELTETEADLDLAKVSVIVAENDLANAFQRFVLYVGDGEYTLAPVIPDPDVIEAASGRPLDEWLDIAKARNYDLQITRLRLDIAENNIRLAQQAYYPSATLSASWNRSRDNLGRGSVSNGDGNRNAALTLEIPLYQGGRRSAQLQAAYVAYDRQKLRIAQQAKQLQQQVTDLYRNRQSLHKRTFALQSLVASNRKKLEATKDGFARGDRTSNEVLEAQNLLVQSEIDLISALHDFILSGLQLKQAAGILSLEDIKAVNRLYFTAT